MTADWETVQLSEIARRLTRRNAEGHDNVLTISAQDGLVNQETYFNKRVASKNLSKYFLLHRGDFAYNKSSSKGYPIGAIKRLEMYPKGVVSPLYICFEIEDRGKAEPDFLVQYFESGLFEKEVRSIAKEGARSHGALNVKPDEFLALWLPLPPFPEQRKIAAILSSVDAVIEKTEAVIEQLQVVKKAMMQELLTRGLPGRHTRFKQTEIGEIPEAWEVRSVESVITSFQNGYAFRSKEYTESGIPVVSMACIGLDGQFRMTKDKTKYWSEDDLLSLKKFVINKGDLLIAMTDVTLDKKLVGRMVNVTVDGPLYLNQRVGWLKVDGAVMDKEFLRYVSHGERWRNYAKVNASLGAQANISTVAINGGLVPVPSMGEQRRIVAALRSADSLIDRNRESVIALGALKDGLMSVLLTGELRVTPDEETA